MNTSHITFMADMLLKVSFVASRSDRNVMPPSSFLQVSQVCISGFVFCLSEHIPICHIGGKEPGVELNLCLHNL